MYFLESHIYSEVLQQNLAINVLLPQGIKPKEKVKTLYLLHGYLGDYMDWMRLSAIERYASLYRTAIIMPSAYNSYYTDTTYDFNYYTFISKELPEIVESMFPLSKKGKDRMIGGLSMGGYGAMKIALSNPTKYAKVFTLSGALDVEHIRELTRQTRRKTSFDAVFGKKSTTGSKHDLKALVLKHQKAGRELPAMMITCGSEDFLIESNINFHQFLVDQKVPHGYEISPGAHDWSYWDETIEWVLKWVNE